MESQNNVFIEKGLQDCIASINKIIKQVNLLEKSDKPEIIKNIETNIKKELECFVSLFNAFRNLREIMESATIPSSLYDDLVKVKGNLSDLNQTAKKCLSKNVIDFHNYILTRIIKALILPEGADVKANPEIIALGTIPFLLVWGGLVSPAVRQFYFTMDPSELEMQIKNLIQVITTNN
jgi:hypothetical protein